ncbi:DUF4837 family protein [bacterium SCSIO 12741]|nr:DUF4837 family protein [bacterium SCSIO 12741]
MKKTAWILLSTFALFFLISCESEEGEFLPGYSGGFGELVVVLDKAIWEGPTGDSLFSVLAGEQHGFPQPESYFNVIQVSPSKFQSVLRTHRNIIRINAASGNAGKEPLVLERNKWSKGQYVLNLNAKSYDHLLQVIGEHEEDIRSVFQSAEINRHIQRNKKFGDPEISKELAAVQQYTMEVHKDVFLDKNQSGLAWVRAERERTSGGFQHQISQGILLFSKPYMSKSDFSDSLVIQTANEMMAQHLAGPDTGQYMQIDQRYIPVIGEEVNFHDQYAREFRGIWKMEGNFMGGPLYIFTFLDEPRGRIIYAIGYVYAPQFKKREYLREVEAMIQSIKPTPVPQKASS